MFPVVAVQRGDVHVPGGHREQRRQRTQRDAGNKGAAAVVVVSRCSRSLGGLSASFTSVTQPCSTCMPSTTSGSGKKATHALVIHKGGEKSEYAKKQGKTSGEKCPGGNVRLPACVFICTCIKITDEKTDVKPRALLNFDHINFFTENLNRS